MAEKLKVLSRYMANNKTYDFLQSMEKLMRKDNRRVRVEKD